MLLPNLRAVSRYSFDPSMDVVGKVAFTARWSPGAPNRLFAGVQTGNWQSDEQMWDYDGSGTYRGPKSNNIVPTNLRLQGGIPVADRPGENATRLATGTHAYAVFEIPDNADVQGLLGNQSDILYRLYRASNGSLAASSTISSVKLVNGPSLTIDLGVLADGSYTLWTCLTNLTTVSPLPLDYVTVAGAQKAAYFYVEDGVEYYYDPVYNVGQLPTAPNDLLNQRATILADNKQKDRAEWTGYLSSKIAQSAEWSAIRFIIGSGPWTQGTGTPSPGPALYEIIDASTVNPVNFDPMARSISATLTDRSGRVLIAGRRATNSGPIMALWQLSSDGSATLLGQNPDPTTGTCECAKADHGPTKMVQLKNGDILILTHCSLHRYEPRYADINLTLPGYPAMFGGHPGGQALCAIDDRVFYFSEYFRGSAMGNDAKYFYNYLVDQVGTTRIVGPGTRYHGYNCADSWHGVLWGIKQDFPDSDPKAQQYITWYSDGEWVLTAPPTDSAGSQLSTLPNAASGLQFPASHFFWQKLIACDNVLFAAGHVRESETPLFGVADGQYFRLLSTPYRFRNMTTCLGNSGKQEVVTIAREVVSSSITPNWQVVTFDLDSTIIVVDFCTVDSGATFCVSLTELATQHVTNSDLPPYLIWNPAFFCWQESQNPSADDTVYLAHVTDSTTACYQLRQAPLDTFTWHDDTRSFLASVSSLESAAIVIADLPAYLWWSGTAWTPHSDAPTDPDTYYLIRDADTLLVRYNTPPGCI